MSRSGRSSGRWSLGPWLISPALLLLGWFVFRPLVRSVQLSAYASDILGNPDRYVGLRNWSDLLSDPAFMRTVLISIVIALLSTAMATGAALFAVLLLRTRLVGKGLLNIVFSLPFAYSAASASAVFAGLFAPEVGELNIVLGHLGIGGPAWLSSPFAAVWAVAIASAWYEFGFAFLVLTAAVRDVPIDVIAAASLDGAAGVSLARRILVPMMRPSILFLTVTETITGLQSFAQIQVLTRGGPSGRTTTLVYRLYLEAFGNGVPDFGRASVIAIVLVILVGLITAVQFRLVGRDVSA